MSKGIIEFTSSSKKISTDKEHPFSQFVWGEGVDVLTVTLIEIITDESPTDLSITIGIEASRLGNHPTYESSTHFIIDHFVNMFERSGRHYLQTEHLSILMMQPKNKLDFYFEVNGLKMDSILRMHFTSVDQMDKKLKVPMLFNAMKA